MLQRKQTLYLAVALIALLYVFFAPIGTFGSGEPTLFNYGFVLPILENGASFNTEPYQGLLADSRILALAVILIVAMLTIICTIFGYKNRKRQAKCCTFIATLLVAWGAYLAYIYYFLKQVVSTELSTSFGLTLSIIAPVVSLVFVLLARKAILADEALVRAADRIR